MANNLNTPWARLTQQEKAELIGIYTRHGYHDLAGIIKDYNEYSNGGNKSTRQNGNISPMRTLYENGYDSSGTLLRAYPDGGQLPVFSPLADFRASHPMMPSKFKNGGKTKKLIETAKNVARRILDLEARHAETYPSKDFTFDGAYKDARKKGQRTFFWDGKYYNTDYEGAHGKQYKADIASGKASAFSVAYPGFVNPELRKEKQEELDTYGITNEQTQNKTWLNERALKNLDFYGDYDFRQAIDALILNHDQRVESDTSPDNLTHYQQLRYYLGYPLLNQDPGKSRNNNGFGAPVRISKFAPTSGSGDTPYYYTFLRNPYGNEGITNGPVRETYERLISDADRYLNGQFYDDAEKYGIDYAEQVANENTKKFSNYFDKHIEDLAHLERLENFIPSTYRGRFETRDFGNVSGLGHFTQYGTPEYRSFYDLWDIGLGQGNATITAGIGKPFEYYDRRYHDDATKRNLPDPDIDKIYSEFDYRSGGQIPGVHERKKGGKIHIDPSKRGTFRAQATKMGMSVKQAAAHILANKDRYSPEMVKKANFARNFAGDGGFLDLL